jgi:hypothetical protein
MRQDPWAGWACDGDVHWTPTLVRDWWQERDHLRQWIIAKHDIWADAASPDEREAANGLMDYLAYIDTELANDLRAYMYFLDGSAPANKELLPQL